MVALIRQAAEVEAFGNYLKEAARRTPVGRLLQACQKAGRDSRLSVLASDLGLSDSEFSAALAEAEHGGLVVREERDGRVFVLLTSLGLARLEAMNRM